MVSTYIWVDTIASSDGVRKVCCPDGYQATHFLPPAPQAMGFESCKQTLTLVFILKRMPHGHLP